MKKYVSRSFNNTFLKTSIFKTLWDLLSTFDKFLLVLLKATTKLKEIEEK